MRHLFKTLCALLAVTSTALGQSLPHPVEQALTKAGIARSNVAVVVQEAGSARTALAINSRAAMNPASVMKLVTTYSALELLGPAYRWKTEVYAEGEDLYLKGYGDPKLNLESFWLMLRALRARGLRDIKGDIYLDRSWFLPQPEAPFDDDTYRPYNVTPDALLVNFKTLRFVFVPDGSRAAVSVHAEPALPGLEIVNQLRLVEGPSCPEGRAFRERIQADFQPRPPRAAFTGAYAAACGERELSVALYQPEDYVTAMVRHLWTEMGGWWGGRARVGTLSPTARLVYLHESEPLALVVRDINKFSNNVMARQLYLTLGAELGGAPGRPELAFTAVKQWLEKKPIKAPELVIENGSGLSRIERVSAANLAAMLQAAWRSPVMPEFVSSLPVVAYDGSEKKRLKDDPVAGRAHLKTGLLSDVRSMAGYVLDRRGRMFTVVMIMNDAHAPEADAAMDALLRWVYEGARARARPRTSPPAASSRHP